jgi:hypothetical protein
MTFAPKTFKNNNFIFLENEAPKIHLRSKEIFDIFKIFKKILFWR